MTSLQERKCVFAQVCICGCLGDGHNIDKDDGKGRQTEEGSRQMSQNSRNFEATRGSRGRLRMGC